MNSTSEANSKNLLNYVLSTDIHAHSTFMPMSTVGEMATQKNTELYGSLPQLTRFSERVTPEDLSLINRTIQYSASGAYNIVSEDRTIHGFSRPLGFLGYGTIGQSFRHREINDPVEQKVNPFPIELHAVDTRSSSISRPLKTEIDVQDFSKFSSAPFMNTSQTSFVTFLSASMGLRSQWIVPRQENVVSHTFGIDTRSL